MSANGKRRPPRPRIELVSPARSATEAAAVVAAVEQFLAETAPVAEPAVEFSRWQATALREGVAAKELTGGAWGHAPTWNET